MSLLESLSKPRWQHRDPEVRLAAVREIANDAVLLEVLESDQDPAVQGAALERIGSVDTLDRLLHEQPAWLAGDLLRQARQQRLGQLLAEGGALPPQADDELLLRIAALADDAQLLDRAIGRIVNPQARLDLACNHPQARARLRAAQSIDDVEILQSLLQQARHKDKAVYRHCRERLDRHLAEQRAEEERKQDLSRLAGDAAALREAPDSPEFRPRYLALQGRWEALRTHATQAQLESISADLSSCAERLEKRAETRAQAEREAAEVDAARQEFGVLLEELAALDPLGLRDTNAIEALGGQLDRFEERWVSALRLATPESARTESFKAGLSRWRVALHTVQRLTARRAEVERLQESVHHLDKADYRAVQKLRQQAARLVKALPWPEVLAAGMPAALAALRDQQEVLVRRESDLEQRAEKNRARVEKALESFRAELASNHYRNADRALNRLRNLLRQLPPNQQNRVEQELKPLQARLQEIHGWQGFAVAPKKQELIEKMRALAGCSDDPDTLAAKIKALQGEWKSLGPLAPRRDQSLWNEFRAAADEAWAPCKEAFEQRAEARKEFYRQRMALVAQLKAYEKGIAWPDIETPDEQLPTPDWKMVRKTLTTARKAFAELGPVDHRQERKSHKALDKICNRIYAHLEMEYAGNIERKKGLVAEAQALVEMEDLKQAVQRAKAIQAEWKAVGLTPRNADRPLWKDFRKACDAVFARLGEEREQRNAQARARSDQRRADEQARRERAADHKRKEQEGWQRLLDRMQACALKPDQPQRAAELWGEDGDLPRGIDADALQAWWDDGPGNADEASLREACIALEVLNGLESPPEEKKARMAYQMKRLVEGMGSAPVDGQTLLVDSINQFLSLRPSQSWVKRFCRVLEKAGIPTTGS